MSDVNFLDVYSKGLTSGLSKQELVSTINNKGFKFSNGKPLTVSTIGPFKRMFAPRGKTTAKASGKIAGTVKMAQPRAAQTKRREATTEHGASVIDGIKHLLQNKNLTADQRIQAALSII